MITIRCNCPLNQEGSDGHWQCHRFGDHATQENVELCKQHPIM